MKLIVWIASDHAGLQLKQSLIRQIQWVEWKDLGTNSPQSVDYPDYADLVAQNIKNEDERGILICGSGQGMAIRANRYPHIRAALCWDTISTRLAREHNNANVLAIGGRLIPEGLAIQMVEVFLKTEFLGDRHKSRVDKLSTPIK